VPELLLELSKGALSEFRSTTSGVEFMEELMGTHIASMRSSVMVSVLQLRVLAELSHSEDVLVYRDQCRSLELEEEVVTQKGEKSW
jgi:hypothetical protein